VFSVVVFFFFQAFAKLKPSLVVTGPNGVLLSLTGKLDYREGKQLRTNAVMEMKETLEKPISFSCTLTLSLWAICFKVGQKVTVQKQNI
jgi:hypothetical protein